ncbi:transient receptor potential cation channel protein painless-like [Ceratina calcarata]|uniref:Transient receptor potential cation channel protein painless-like n=1 Tax=Ceratina calcarata TaxID=156304 RepID=A0AAJ7NA83_9HYME|nr:transient receptor potential cation channel protein painless-like [Ceratina calcarata]
MDSKDVKMHLLCDYTSSSKSQTIYKLLWEYVQSRKFENFKCLLEQNLDREPPAIDVNHIYSKESNKTWLDVAIEKDFPEFVQFLLNKGANVNRVNKTLNRGPIHLATERACKTGKFEVLDILLKERTINPNLEAAQRTALHFAVKEQNLECARRLLEKGASPNILNTQGVTALHLAAMQKDSDMVNLIMTQSKHILKLEYEDYNEQTTRELLKKNFPNIQLPPPVEKQGANVQDLKSYLNNHDEVNFLKCLEEVEEDEVNKQAENLIELAIKNNLPNTVAALLKKTDRVKPNLEKAASLAIQKGSPDILRQLLETVKSRNIKSRNVENSLLMDDGKLLRPDLNVEKLLMDACIELSTPTRKDCGTAEERLNCFKMIVKEDVDLRCKDSKDGKKNTPLHHAASADCREAMTQLLEKGSYIGDMNAFNIPAIADIPVSILSKYFDDCIQAKREKANEYTIEFNYKCLMPKNPEFYMERQNKNVIFSDESIREMDVFRYIAGNNNLKQLLTHPLLSSFLYLKWHRIRHIVYLNFVFYLIVYVLLNAYILRTTYVRGNNTETNSIEIEGEAKELSVHVLRIFTGIALGLLALREFLQLLSSPSDYLWSSENWIEMTLVIFAFITINDGNVQIVAMTILLSAWELVIQMGKHPRMSTSIEMFKTVSFNFMHFFFFYAFLILAFALAFFTIFKDGENFPDPGRSLFKTIIMLTGEFEAGDIPFNTHPIFSHLIFVLFVFLIAIVLFNLLNGLAVSDTAEILHKAELVGLISRIKVLAYFENIACGKMYTWKFNPLTFLVEKVLLFPSYLRSGKLTVQPQDGLEISRRLHYKAQPDTSSETLSEKVMPTFKIDPSVIKQAKDILSKRRQETDNEKLFNKMNKLEERFDVIETVLVSMKETIDNNVNVARDN